VAVVILPATSIPKHTGDNFGAKIKFGYQGLPTVVTVEMDILGYPKLATGSMKVPYDPIGNYHVLEAWGVWPSDLSASWFPIGTPVEAKIRLLLNGTEVYNSGRLLYAYEVGIQGYTVSPTPTPTQYTCPYCGMAFNTDLALQSHILTYHKYQCPYCGLIFTTSEGMYAHIAAAHPSPPPPSQVFPCAFCSATFLTRAEQEQHIEQAHPAKLVCGYCGQTFVTIAEMDEHIVTMHPGTVT